MDARTTIAKDVLCALLRCDDADMSFDGIAHSAVKYTDALINTLAIKGSKDDPTPQPAPAPARGVPVWRKIDDPPSHDLPVMLSRRGPKQLPAPAIYANRKWVWCETKTEVIAPQQFDWLDLNGFTPEVGE